MVRRIASFMAALAIASATLLGAAPSPAAAYSHTTAWQYADAHWNQCGVPNKYPCLPNDCTNFISQALIAGGYPQHGPCCGNDDDHHWYIVAKKGGGWIWSHTWSYAHDLRDFLRVDVPGGWDRGTYAGTTLIYDSGAGNGDVLFYNWDGDGDWDHVSMVVGFGQTADGYYGDMVDYHSNNRYHIFWTGRTYNTSIQTTTINAMYVDSAN